MLSIALHGAIPGFVSIQGTDAELMACQFPIYICYRLFPLTEPNRFRHTIKMVQPDDFQDCLANQMIDPEYN